MIGVDTSFAQMSISVCTAFFDVSFSDNTFSPSLALPSGGIDKRGVQRCFDQLGRYDWLICCR